MLILPFRHYCHCDEEIDIKLFCKVTPCISYDRLRTLTARDPFFFACNHIFRNLTHKIVFCQFITIPSFVELVDLAAYYNPRLYYCLAKTLIYLEF